MLPNVSVKNDQKQTRARCVSQLSVNCHTRPFWHGPCSLQRHGPTLVTARRGGRWQWCARLCLRDGRLIGTRVSTGACGCDGVSTRRFVKPLPLSNRVYLLSTAAYGHRVLYTRKAGTSPPFFKSRADTQPRATVSCLVDHELNGGGHLAPLKPELAVTNGHRELVRGRFEFRDRHRNVGDVVLWVV